MTLKRTKKLSDADLACPINFVSSGTDLLMLPRESTAVAASRFDEFIRWMLRNARGNLTPAHQLIVCSIAMEALTNMEDLLGFLCASAGLVSRDTEIHVAWTVKEDLYRRAVSSVTALAIASLPNIKIDWLAELVTLSERLPEKIYPSTRDFRATQRLTHVFSDAGAWLYLHLPNACFAYVSGKLKLTVLPDSVYERRLGLHTQKACTTPSAVDILAHVKDVACDASFSDDSSTSRSRWIIFAIKDLLREHSNGDRIRTADHLARNVVRRRLESIISTLMRSGTPVDALLLSWLIFLFESGSVRVRNPKLGTISRYVHAAAEILLQTLRAISSAPADLDQDDWEVIFKQMLQGDVSNELRCALASFHYFLQSHFGIDPMPWLFHGVREQASANANYVWPNELHSAFELVTCVTSDPRMQPSILVMLAIAIGGPVRAGEIRSLRVRDIKAGDGKLIVYLLPKRSHHQGKSHAARRALDLSHSPHRLLIETWQQRRRDESAEEDDLLFGDPQFPSRGYRLGTCQRLINQLLRMATGDSLVSFHTLRHMQICDGLLDALMEAAVHQSISNVHRIKVQAGHQHERTTFLSYFHVPEKAIRYWIDQSVADRINRPVVVASWIGVSADTLRQNRYRAKDKCLCLSELLRDCAHRKVVGTSLPSRAEVSCLSDSTVVAPPRITYDYFFRLLTDIGTGLGMRGICARNAINEDNVVRVCRITAELISRLKSGTGKKISALSANANNQVALEHAHQAIGLIGCHFESTVEPHLNGLAHFLTKATFANENLRSAADSWIKCKNDHVLSLTDAEAVKPLINLLVQSGVSFTNMLLRIQTKDPYDAIQAAEMRERNDVIAARTAIEFTCSRVQIESVCTCSGRPDIYLLLSRNRLGTGEAGTSAACRMNRFHALMLALAVWVEFEVTFGRSVDDEHRL